MATLDDLRKHNAEVQKMISAVPKVPEMFEQASGGIPHNHVLVGVKTVNVNDLIDSGKVERWAKLIKVFKQVGN